MISRSSHLAPKMSWRRRGSDTSTLGTEHSTKAGLSWSEGDVCHPSKTISEPSSWGTRRGQDGELAVAIELWQSWLMICPISTLQLRRSAIPRGVLHAQLERDLGRPLTHVQRYYVSGQPVHCGEFLELYRGGLWVEGQYEWTGHKDDNPTLHTNEGVFWLDESSLLRWPMTRVRVRTL